MRLGCMSGGSTVSSGTPRFNEAEAHAPRMPGGDQPGADDIAPRFNEAEAHAPRMRYRHGRPARPGARFNEAEAHAPRMPAMSDLYANPTSRLQ